MEDGGGPLRLATRGSRQALAQATAVATAIERASSRPVEMVLVETTGDVRQDVALHTIGGQGVFVKEVQRAVLDGRADLAVHSAKDLPSEPAEGLRIAAFTERRSPADVLVGSTLDELAEGATVASGSVRRRAQLAVARPDLRFVELRGNIDTRLSRIPESGAIVMALAALEILEMTDRAAERLDVDRFVPAVGQGCVAVECRVDDVATAGAVATVDHAATRRAVEIERAFLAELGGGCTMPVGGHVHDDELHVFLADPAQGRAEGDVVALGEGGSHDDDLARGREAARAVRSRLA
ncbi:hydroxymethylbilane synthase [Ilumatobacter sp.]|uniref:hydroxymethylbilane synthase n=1 Tax=Ilumatobacter sp. TaxID=1967498 RepID=UPI003B52AB46